VSEKRDSWSIAVQGRDPTHVDNVYLRAFGVLEGCEVRLLVGLLGLTSVASEDEGEWTGG
jgi:hypothetical protein